LEPRVFEFFPISLDFEHWLLKMFDFFTVSLCGETGSFARTSARRKRGGKPMIENVFQ
jgi:hypothetical protein